jgi:hypothetical protein
LPHDNETLNARVRALASWCNGFVVGLGLGGLTLDAKSQETEEVLEIVRDFIEIGKADIDVEVEGDPETSEESFAEVAEFVRVGVQIVFEEIARARVGESATVH